MKKAVFGGLILILLLGVNFFPTQQRKTVIFVPGLGLHEQDYTTLRQRLQEDGYLVLSYNPKYSNEHDYGRMVDVWTRDVGKLARNRKVIVVGHSVGGAVAVHFCATDTRCIAGVNMDGSPSQYEKLSVPFLYLQADVGKYCEQDCMDGRKLMETIAFDSGSDVVRLPGMKHFNFVDESLHPDKALLEGDYLGTINSKKGLAIITGRLLDFLHKHVL